MQKNIIDPICHFCYLAYNNNISWIGAEIREFLKYYYLETDCST